MPARKYKGGPKERAYQSFRTYRLKLRAQGRCECCAKEKDRPDKTCCKKCRATRRIYNIVRNRELKQLVIDAYGGKCACCGEKLFEFLCIEHSRNDGAKQRRELKYGTGRDFYLWLSKRGFPKDLGLEILCFNCNCARGSYGYCPHGKSLSNPLTSTGI